MLWSWVAFHACRICRIRWRQRNIEVREWNDSGIVRCPSSVVRRTVKECGFAVFEGRWWIQRLTVLWPAACALRPKLSIYSNLTLFLYPSRLWGFHVVLRPIVPRDEGRSG